MAAGTRNVSSSSNSSADVAEDSTSPRRIRGRDLVRFRVRDEDEGDIIAEGIGGGRPRLSDGDEGWRGRVRCLVGDNDMRKYSNLRV